MNDKKQKKTTHKYFEKISREVNGAILQDLILQ